jgi:hypothetical protein
MSAPNSADELAAPVDVLLIDAALGPMRSGLGGPASSFLRSLSDFSDDEVRSRPAQSPRAAGTIG